MLAQLRVSLYSKHSFAKLQPCLLKPTERLQCLVMICMRSCLAFPEHVLMQSRPLSRKLITNPAHVVQTWPLLRHMLHDSKQRGAERSDSR